MTLDFDAEWNRLGTGSKKWSKYPADVLPLWVADMDFAVAPEILAALRARLDHPVLGYAAPQDSLRAQIVASMQDNYGWRIAPEAIVFLPGVEPGFNMALKAFLEPGDGVLVQTPAYSPILGAPDHWGLRRVEAPLPSDGGPIDMDRFRAAAAAARAFLFCHPHNPLGRVFSRGELIAMAAACLDAGVLILSDEIHCDLLHEARRHIPMAALDDAVAKTTITLMSASKTYNIAGLKTAFAIIPNAALRARFDAGRLGLVDSVNLMGLEATRAAYGEAGAWKAGLLAYLQANRDHLAAVIAARFPGIVMHKPQATFLAWLDCRALGRDPYALFLDHARVGLSPGAEFGEQGAGFVRLNFGCTRKTLDAALDRMEAALTV